MDKINYKNYQIGDVLPVPKVGDVIGFDEMRNVAASHIDDECHFFAGTHYVTAKLRKSEGKNNFYEVVKIEDKTKEPSIQEYVKKNGYPPNQFRGIKKLSLGDDRNQKN